MFVSEAASGVARAGETLKEEEAVGLLSRTDTPQRRRAKNARAALALPTCRRIAY